MATSKEHFTAFSMIQKIAAVVVAFAAIAGAGNALYQHFAKTSDLAVIQQTVADVRLDASQEKACDSILRYGREISRLENDLLEPDVSAPVRAGKTRNIATNERAQERLRPKAADDCEPSPE